LAASAHRDHIDHVIEKALKDAHVNFGISFSEIVQGLQNNILLSNI
jgi:hypothetical protein